MDIEWGYVTHVECSLSSKLSCIDQQFIDRQSPVYVFPYPDSLVHWFLRFPLRALILVAAFPVKPKPKALPKMRDVCGVRLQLVGVKMSYLENPLC
jgi:hypothetical protein